MVQKFQNHIVQNFPFLTGKKLLLATSGGLDSMVLVALCQRLSLDFALAHCNFQLRGGESDEDQKFIQNFSESNGIQLFQMQFDTKSFAKTNKLSTQVAARELRYDWFETVLETEKFDYILTAHHADDNVETFLIHLTRGTGLKGLTGIPAQNNNIIRPLLIFSRQEIEDFAHENDIKWREDSSNASDNYLRNKIRHHLVPVLKELNPDFLTTFQKTQTFLQDSSTMIADASKFQFHQLAKEIGNETHFDLLKLKQLPNYKAYLYHWLQDFGFTAWDDIHDLVEGQTGKQVYSKDFRLLKNRETLILVSKKENEDFEEIFIEKNQKEVNFPLNLSFCKVTDIQFGSEDVIFVDEDKLVFPLVLRKSKTGDFLQPFGMKGKTKKLSKLFKDEKLSLIEKENNWILCSENQIVWVIGIKQDERFKITDTTKNILKIELQK